MASALTIGKVELASRVLVAPMSGVTDLPFRRVLSRFQPGCVVSEMVAGKEFAEGSEESERRAAGSGEFDPFVIQLVGREAEWMAAGARRAEELGADIIDINMGCPARKVTTGLSGSALMRDLDHACRLIAATVRATSRPVTLKMRLGWDHDSLNAAELALRAEALGVRLVTVHGRTRCQFYEGEADWTAIREVSEAVSVPVVVNGDIDGGSTARAALAESGAQAVMVGRALVGRPWGLRDIRAGLGESVSHAPIDRARIAHDHYRDIIATHGERRGVRVARRHVAAYLDHASVEDATRGRLVRSFDPDEVADGLLFALSQRVAA